MIRTHDAGSLRAADIDSEVTLAGWIARRRDHGGVAFFDLRDASGVVQIVLRDEAPAHALRKRVLRAGDRVGPPPARGTRTTTWPPGTLRSLLRTWWS